MYSPSIALVANASRSKAPLTALAANSGTSSDCRASRSPRSRMSWSAATVWESSP